MLTTILTDRTLPTQEQIQQLESDLSIVLPEDFKRFLAQFNYGEPKEYDASFPHFGATLDSFIGISEIPDWEIREALVNISDWLPKDCFPFGYSPGGDHFILSTRHDSYGQVYYFDHEESEQNAFDPSNNILGKAFTKITNSFTEFLEGLVDPENRPIPNNPSAPKSIATKLKTTSPNTSAPQTISDTLNTVKEFLELVQDATAPCKCETCNQRKHNLGNKEKDSTAWMQIDYKLPEYFKNFGRIQELYPYIRKNGYTQYIPDGINPWGDDAPIALAYYPYTDSQVIQCRDCSTFFITYIETGGFSPLRYLRLIKKDLIDLTGLSLSSK